MSNRTGPESWTLDELRAFGRGALVSARDGEGRTVPVPDHLDFPSVDAQDVSSRTELIHPADRAAVAQAWLDAIDREGEVVEVGCRAKIGDTWHRMVIGYLDLLSRPDIGCVLIRVGYEGALAGEEAEEAEDSSAESEAPSWAIVYLGKAGEIIDVIGRPEEIFHRTADELRTRRVVDFIHPDDRAATLAAGMELITSPGATLTLTQRVLRADGGFTWVESTVLNPGGGRGSGGNDKVAVLSITHDISEKRAREEALRASREEFRLLAEEIPAAAFRAGASGEITFGNARWYQFVSSCGEPDDIHQLVAEEDRPKFDTWWQKLISRESGAHSTTDFRCSDGERTLSLSCRVISGPGSDIALIGVLHDITDKMELKHRAEHDSLTGLMNRDLLELHLSEIAENGESEATSVVFFLDIDQFKEVNDTFGHAAGDLVLQEVASRLRAVFRPEDAIARVGGDEFVIVCRECGPALVEQLKHRLDRAMEAPIEGSDFSWNGTLSIGVAILHPGDDVASVLRRADADMYRNKRAG